MLCTATHEKVLRQMLKVFLDCQLFTMHLHMAMLMLWICCWMQVSTHLRIFTLEHLLPTTYQSMFSPFSIVDVQKFSNT